MTQVATGQGRSQSIKIALAFSAIYVIWGTTYLAIRIAIETIPPFLMAGTRFLIAGSLVFIFLLIKGVPLPRRFHWRSAVIVGALLLLGGNGLVTWSEQEIPSGMAALVVATVPMWMMLFEWLIFRGKAPNKQIVIGVLIGFLGIFLLIGPAQLMGNTDFGTFSLMVLMMAPILWSFGSLYSRKVKLPDNVFMSTATEMLAGGIIMLFVGLIVGETSQLKISQFSLRSMGAMLYLMVFGSIVAFTAYLWLLKTVQPSKVATYTYVNPIIAVFLGWFILNETITPLSIIAIVAIVLSVVLITTQRKKQVFDSSAAPSQSVVLNSEAAAD
jgi:drug/metabolite transporter (DMT)-like permease